MNLLYLTFGDKIEPHLQAIFSILSFLSAKTFLHSITVITTDSTYYSNYRDYIDIIEISKKEMNEWRGDHDYLYRVKIKAIQLLHEKYPEQPIVYLDSDTFLLKDIHEFHQSLINGAAFMHENEGMLKNLKTKTEKKMWRKIHRRSFGGINISDSQCMWNAGVIGLPGPKNKEAIDLALNICDEMCSSGITKRLIEQVSFSIAVQDTYPLAAAENWIGHYWGNKEDWNKWISRFFLEAHFKSFSMDETVQKIKSMDFHALPICNIRSNANRRFSTMLDALFPPKKVVFLKP